jgi:hypothetical protein
LNNSNFINIIHTKINESNVNYETIHQAYKIIFSHQLDGSDLDNIDSALEVIFDNVNVIIILSLFKKET